MYVSQVPIFELAVLVGLFMLPAVFWCVRYKECLNRKEIIAYILFALLLTAASLFLYGSRGGLPPATVYGWPKEFIITREGEVWHFYSFYIYG